MYINMFPKVFIVICCILLELQGAKIPSFVPLCKRHDPNLNQCFVKACNTVLERLGDGIPQMRLRKFDPMLIEKISFDQNDLALALNLTNTKVFGITKGKVLSADIDLDQRFWNLSMEIPNIYFESDVRSKGKLLSFQIESNGQFQGNISGISSNCVWTADKQEKNGQTWFKNFRSNDFKLDIKHMHVHFDNIFPNKQINEDINKSVNENIDVLHKDLLPLISSTIKSILSDATNNVHDAFPVEILFE